MTYLAVLQAIAHCPQSEDVLDTVCAALDAGVPIASAQEPLRALALLIIEDPAVADDENAIYLTLSMLVGELRRRHRELN